MQQQENDLAYRIDQLRGELYRMVNKPVEQAWPQALGASFERGLLNIATTMRDSQKSFRDTMLWSALVLGASLATTLTVLVICIWRLA